MTRPTNFDNVLALNEVFNVAFGTKSKPDWLRIEAQMDLIAEEFDELVEAVETNNWEQMKDAIGDILVTAYGMGHVAQFDCDKLMDNISVSNFSKLCRTSEEVAETTKFYTDLGVPTYVEQTELNGVRVWAVKVAETTIIEIDGVQKGFPANKFLKNVNWTQPDLNVEF